MCDALSVSMSSLGENIPAGQVVRCVVGMLSLLNWCLIRRVIRPGRAGDAKLGRDLHLNRLFPPLSYESA